MRGDKSNVLFLMRPVPFFILLALCGPLALALVLIYWRDLPEDRRGPHMIMSILFSLTYTLVLFITYSIWGRKRKREKE